MAPRSPIQWSVLSLVLQSLPSVICDWLPWWYCPVAGCQVLRMTSPSSIQHAPSLLLAEDSHQIAQAWPPCGRKGEDHLLIWCMKSSVEDVPMCTVGVAPHQTVGKIKWLVINILTMKIKNTEVKCLWASVSHLIIEESC